MNESKEELFSSVCEAMNDLICLELDEDNPMQEIRRHNIGLLLSDLYDGLASQVEIMPKKN